METDFVVYEVWADVEETLDGLEITEARARAHTHTHAHTHAHTHTHTHSLRDVRTEAS